MKITTSVIAIVALAGCEAMDTGLVEDEPAAATGERAACAGKQLAEIETETGTVVDFCALDDGALSIGETGPLGTHSAIAGRRFNCALDLFIALAPTLEIPLELVEACADRQALGDGPFHAADDELPASITGAADGEDDAQVSASHYCSGGGPVEFEDERCSQAWDVATSGNFYDWRYWCNTGAYSWAQRTMSSQMGHKGNTVYAAVGSCNGTTRLRLSHDTGGGFSTVIDEDVNSGYWKARSLVHTSSAIDRDYRFRGDAYGSAWFRNTGFFGDFQWP